MFEKYNEKARRALFFARYEASKLGSRVIESEHILLGILREGEETVSEIFRRFQVKPEDIRREIEGERVFVERISSTAELPLSEESKKILAYASHEAESMLHPTVGSEHLLIGILRVEGCTAMRILAQHGFDVYTVREEVLAIAKEREASQQKKELPFLSEYGRDLTSLATGAVLRSADRPRRGGRPDHPDPLPPHQEQPDPAGRAGRRQDRDRRGPGAAHRRGAGADLPRQQADPGARPVADRRRHQVPRPVRGAAEGDPEGAQGQPGADRLHRRDPLADRRRLGRGVARRGQHPEAGAVARRDLLHRRDDAQGVPQVHREGPVAAAPLPGDPGATRRRRSRPGDPRRGQGPLRVVPQGALPPGGAAHRDLPVEPLHPGPPPAGQGDRRARRGGRAGQAAPGARHPEPAPARAGDPPGGQGDEDRDLRQGLRARRLPARAGDRAARGPRADERRDRRDRHPGGDPRATSRR